MAFEPSEFQIRFLGSKVLWLSHWNWRLCSRFSSRASAVIQSPWPLSLIISAPDLTSQSLMVLSSLPEAIQPSGREGECGHPTTVAHEPDNFGTVCSFPKLLMVLVLSELCVGFLPQSEGILGVVIRRGRPMEHRKFLQRLDELAAELTHAQAQKVIAALQQRGDGGGSAYSWSSAWRTIPNARTAARAALKVGAGRGTACRAAASLISNAPSIR